MVSLINRQRHSKDEDVFVMTQILSDLPDPDREALTRYYVGGRTNEEIEAALGMNPEHFRELRASVRGEFFKRTGRGG